MEEKENQRKDRCDKAQPGGARNEINYWPGDGQSCLEFELISFMPGTLRNFATHNIVVRAQVLLSRAPGSAQTLAISHQESAVTGRGQWSERLHRMLGARVVGSSRASHRLPC